MDVISFLKMVPAVLGVAGLLTYFMRKREPSDHDLVNLLQNARTTFVVLACAGLIGLTVWLIYRPLPPDHDASLSGEHSPLATKYSFAGYTRSSPERSRIVTG